ncbi:Transglycosylase SLT domain-containing protein [Noviherbaspirillum humi]|uniref:Transglycosylase SLT domain-containing protein n=1 Tax=Noviherbaspirillum humi TaxID=1688639 RepID=A0A239JZP6_9BURK|nr:lytic transglycosylase domain-containing protein [Noviherbaspirillum humi]SNT10264.1 Transglycosylase SLT domain-containing protein [Noviherbaspirillum humi]
MSYRTFILIAALLVSGYSANAQAQAASYGKYTDAYCLDSAAAYHQVNPLILRAIAWQESRGNPNAFRGNTNGSYDIGMMQINTIHARELGRYGIQMGHLYNPCIAAYVAAWHYRRQIDRYGNTWAAVGAYHSHTPHLRDKYAGQVKRILEKWTLQR